jgi:hypothetical protein
MYLQGEGEENGLLGEFLVHIFGGCGHPYMWLLIPSVHTPIRRQRGEHMCVQEEKEGEGKSENQ